VVPFPRTYTVLEVTDAETGDPVAGAIITVLEPGAVKYHAHEDVPISTAPTDDEGHTIVPVETDHRTSDVVLDLCIKRGGVAEEQLRLVNRAGDSATGARSSVTVVDNDAAEPGPPLLMAVPGTGAPLLEIDGYIRSVGVCSADSGEIAWRISTSHRGYYDAIPVGSVPELFRDSTRRGVVIDGVSTTEPIPCPFPVSDAPSGSFTIFARPIFGNEILVGQRYCLDESGLVIDCEGGSD
jgi:hypothetical protein